MLKLWNLLIYGHDHVWKYIGCNRYRDISFGSPGIEMTTVTKYCSICKNIKQSDITGWFHLMNSQDGCSLTPFED